MPENPDFGRRLRDARRAWEQAHDARLVWREVGEQVARILGREPYAPTVVSRWFNKGTEPAEFAVTAALASVLEVDAGWLAFGGGPLLPAQGQRAVPNGNGLRVNAASVEPVPDDSGVEDSPTHGISIVESPPHKPSGLPDVGAGGKHHRPIQKKPPA